MKTLSDLDESILIDYQAWAKSNPDNWDIAKYINYKYDLNAALALSKLYFPDFIEEKGCVILKMRYDQKIFREWYEMFNGDITKVETMCNLYEVKDFFHINTVNYSTDNEYNKAIDNFASVLKLSWELNLKSLYLNKKFNVEVFDEFNTTKITLYSCAI